MTHLNDFISSNQEPIELFWPGPIGFDFPESTGISYAGDLLANHYMKEFLSRNLILKKPYSIAFTLNQSIKKQMDCNLILIGGPKVNPLINKILESNWSEIPFEFVWDAGVNDGRYERFPRYIQCEGDLQFHSKLESQPTGIKKQNQIKYDHGILIISPNPKNNKNWVISVMGCYHVGTAIAAKALLDKSILRDVNQDLEKHGKCLMVVGAEVDESSCELGALESWSLT